MTFFRHFGWPMIFLPKAGEMYLRPLHPAMARAFPQAAAGSIVRFFALHPLSSSLRRHTHTQMHTVMPTHKQARMPFSSFATPSSSSASSPTSHRLFKVNNKVYTLPEDRPVVGILLDGTSQEYIEAATAANLMPNWNTILNRKENKGVHALVSTVFPTYTNPNNVAIICGQLPSVTGICGNYFYDETQDKEVRNTRTFVCICMGWCMGHTHTSTYTHTYIYIYPRAHLHNRCTYTSTNAFPLYVLFYLGDDEPTRAYSLRDHFRTFGARRHPGK